MFGDERSFDAEDFVEQLLREREESVVAEYWAVKEYSLDDWRQVVFHIYGFTDNEDKNKIYERIGRFETGNKDDSDCRRVGKSVVEQTIAGNWFVLDPIGI